MTLLMFAVIIATFGCAAGPQPADETRTNDSAIAEGADMEMVAGTWSGTVHAGGQQVPLVFNLSIDDGSLTATMDSPAQGAKGIPVEEAVFEDGRLTLRLSQMGASYTGDLAEDGTAIHGAFSQGGMEFDLVLTRGYTATDTRRPQDPQPPYPYEVEDVRFANPDAGITLAGTRRCLGIDPSTYSPTRSPGPASSYCATMTGASANRREPRRSPR